MSPEQSHCDLLVVGDEVESVLAAVSAARAGAKVALSRRSTGRLGGLSVRGGLSYMDITPECVTGLFGEFLRRTGLIRVALNPDRADRVLQEMLSEAGVAVISGVETQVHLDSEGSPEAAELAGESGTRLFRPTLVIDATPDADVMRALGVPYIAGLGGLLGEEQNFLGVSPVFRIEGVDVTALRAFEESLRQQPDAGTILDQALPHLTDDERAELVTRPTYAPDDMDYLDILNPLIGIDYHIWRHGDAASYDGAGILIDGANISRLADGSLGFNGLVAQAWALDLDLDDLLAMSQGGPIPIELEEEMRWFERYLRERAGFAGAVVISPEEMYVRQTVTLLARNNMTAAQAIRGGVPPEKAVGTFSYWLDLRGTQLRRKFPGAHLPKPVFNVGLDVALPLQPALRNIGFIGRSAGYSPLGQGTGRIVQHNAMLGEALGIAAALAAATGTPLADIADESLPQVQAMLAARWGEREPFGHPVWSEAEIKASELLRQDADIVARLRESATDLTLI